MAKANEYQGDAMEQPVRNAKTDALGNVIRKSLVSNSLDSALLLNAAFSCARARA